MIQITILLLFINGVFAKQDCIPGSWEDWSECTQKCGPFGTKERSRKIAVLPTSDGKQCYNFDWKETDKCNRFCENSGKLLDDRCVCRGYNGMCCQYDIDECQIANGGCRDNRKCVNTPGSFMCTCRDGFQDVDGTCEDIDECKIDRGGCQELCMNFPGGHSCGCMPPKILEMDGKSCAAENYCASPENIDKVKECKYGCVVVNNAFACECPKGYTFEESTRECKDMDECAEGDFCAGGSCQNQDGYAKCDCGPGRGLDANGRRCIAVNHCELDECSHVCENRNAGHVCLCPAGMVIGRDHRTCEDENECTRSPAPCVNGRCEDLIGSFQCICEAGFELEADNVTCCKIGECIRPLSGETSIAGSMKIIITLGAIAVVAVLALVFAVYRLVKRNVSTSEKVLREIRHGDVGGSHVIYNRNTDSMELETRGIGAEGQTASRAEQFTAIHRRDTTNYGASKDK